MAPARASVSGRAAHCPSCFSRRRGHILLLPLAFRAWSWLVWSLAFLTPFFTRDPFFSLLLPLCCAPSLSLLRKPRPLAGAGPRCNETLHNGVTWPLLSRTHTPWSYPIAYTSLRVATPPQQAGRPPRLPFQPPSCCIMHVPHQINGGCGGPFGPDSCTSIIQAGGRIVQEGGVQELQELEKFLAYVRR